MSTLVLTDRDDAFQALVERKNARTASHTLFPLALVFAKLAYTISLAANKSAFAMAMIREPQD